ncbi:MAG: glutamate--tRNA ligase [Oscillospiraceae bacterium]|nr:glutamate--tRNA ligase [Oscillospiraceae bacterium]
MSTRIANLLFPDVTATPDDLEARYPARATTAVRFAPSPTGFMHIGGLYMSLIDRIFARSTGGVVCLRIEDTDQKRQLDGGVSEIIDTLRRFGVTFDEGAASETEDYGDYGPYRQSLRRELYRVYAKSLVERDLAYPCFCTEEELAALRARQSDENAVIPGYYGKWARCRGLTDDEIAAKLAAGEEYVTRLRSPGVDGKTVDIEDGIRGVITMPENVLDVVIIKKDGLPTYHFAHAVDDHLMRTTDVTRADEWIASLPIHVQLFDVLGFTAPRYYHLSPIMKQEVNESGTVTRRKISKRKDPEARVGYYLEAGYPVAAVTDYLLTVCSAEFEPWRAENPTADVTSFPLDLAKTGVAGALFDFDKLANVSKKLIAAMTDDEVCAAVTQWARDYDASFAAYIAAHADYFRASVPIWHANRMDVSRWEEVPANYPYLYGDDFDATVGDAPATVAAHLADVPQILREYQAGYSPDDDADAWFAKVRAIAETHNYAVSMGKYKKHPEDYAGSVADVSAFIRVALTGRLNTPDLCAIARLLGAGECARRVAGYVEYAENLA